MGHALMENHHGLVVDTETTRAAGFAERLTAVAIIDDLARPHGQRISKRIEEVFGWVKSAAGQSKTRFRGLARVRFAFTLAVAAYNLVRPPRLLETA